MDWTQHCTAVIPCFNEAGTIARVIAGVRRFVPRLVVVDDGSADDTAATARSAGAEVLSLPSNSGKGAALRAGLERAGANGFTWALTLDGDGQHSPDDIPAFFARAEATAAALVIGDRLGNPAGMPWLRRRVNGWMTRRLARLTGATLGDSQCGFRLLHLKAWSGLTLKASRFEVESEMLVAFLAAGHALEFVPIQVINQTRPSRIHPLWDTGRWFRWWWSCCGSRPAGRPV